MLMSLGTKAMLYCLSCAVAGLSEVSPTTEAAPRVSTRLKTCIFTNTPNLRGRNSKIARHIAAANSGTAFVSETERMCRFAKYRPGSVAAQAMRRQTPLPTDVEPKAAAQPGGASNRTSPGSSACCVPYVFIFSRTRSTSSSGKMHGQRRPFQQKCRADFGCRKTQRAQNANLPLALFDAQPEEQARQQ